MKPGLYGGKQAASSLSLSLSLSSSLPLSHSPHILSYLRESVEAVLLLLQVRILNAVTVGRDAGLNHKILPTTTDRLKPLAGETALS